jgi:hypothetical protein
MKQDKKDLIIKYLNSHGVSSTRKISDYIKSNNEDVNKYLNELLSEKKVTFIDVKTAVYWSLKNYKKLPVIKNKDMIKTIKEKIKNGK